MQKRFENQVAIITGGCRGIGKAIVERLASEGARVYALDYVIPEDGQHFVDDANLQEMVTAIQTDVTSADSVNEAVNTVIKEADRVDILVNNAGITRDTLLMRMNEEQWDSVLNTNLKGAFLCVKAVTRQMMGQRSGRIINMGSVVGIFGNAGQVNYSASKAGMIGLTKSLAKEFGSRNICVNLVAPGYVETPMTDELSEDQKKAFLDTIPLKKAAKPEDIANVVSFLASEDASYITGHVIPVDGGLAI